MGVRYFGRSYRLIIFISCFLFGILLVVEDMANKSPISYRSKIKYSFQQPVLELLPKTTNEIIDNDSLQKEISVAQALFKQVRVLCWLMTTPERLITRGKHARATWGRRCNKFVFMTNKKDPSNPEVIALNLTEERNNLWGKTKSAFTYIHRNSMDGIDWVFKADDDTYAIIENLRFMLSKYNPEDPLWFGHRFKHFSKEGYMSGGSGYVLSKKAVQIFVEKAIPDLQKCKQDGTGAEDAELGKCLDKFGVVAVDSRDELKRDRFHPFIPVQRIMAGKSPAWFSKYNFYPTKSGMDCCSETTISFHYIPPEQMYELEFFIYHLRPHGRLPFPLNVPPPDPTVPTTTTTQNPKEVLGQGAPHLENAKKIIEGLTNPGTNSTQNSTIILNNLIYSIENATKIMNSELEMLKSAKTLVIDDASSTNNITKAMADGVANVQNAIFLIESIKRNGANNLRHATKSLEILITNLHKSIDTMESEIKNSQTITVRRASYFVNNAKKILETVKNDLDSETATKILDNLVNTLQNVSKSVSGGLSMLQNSATKKPENKAKVIKDGTVYLETNRMLIESIKKNGAKNLHHSKNAVETLLNNLISTMNTIEVEINSQNTAPNSTTIDKIKIVLENPAHYLKNARTLIENSKNKTNNEENPKNTADKLIEHLDYATQSIQNRIDILKNATKAMNNETNHSKNIEEAIKDGTFYANSARTILNNVKSFETANITLATRSLETLTNLLEEAVKPLEIEIATLQNTSATANTTPKPKKKPNQIQSSLDTLDSIINSTNGANVKDSINKLNNIIYGLQSTLSTQLNVLKETEKKPEPVTGNPPNVVTNATQDLVQDILKGIYNGQSNLKYPTNKIEDEIEKLLKKILE